jgi:hypothetical protein
VEQLIDSSFIDFKIPIKAEFFEFKIYNSLLNFDFDNIEKLLTKLNERYMTDYQNDRVRNSQIYRGNKVLIDTFIDFIDSKNYKKEHNIKEDGNDVIFKEKLEAFGDQLYIIINRLVSQNMSLNNQWMDDKIFSDKIMNYYFNYSKNYNDYLRAFKNILEDSLDRITFNAIYKEKLLKILTSNPRNLDANFFFNIFEACWKANMFDINNSYNDKFLLVRYECLPNIYRLFKNNPEKLYLLRSIYEKILDIPFYESLYKKDKEVLNLFIPKIYGRYKGIQLIEILNKQKM